MTKPEKKFKKQSLRSKASKEKRAFASSLRRNLTMPERILWSRLKDKQLGVRIYSQSLIKGYIADFWFSGGLVIEVDGPIHLTQKGKDKLRDLRLASYGIKTIRFTAQEVVNNLNVVVAIIRAEIFKKLKSQEGKT